MLHGPCTVSLAAFTALLGALACRPATGDRPVEPAPTACGEPRAGAQAEERVRLHAAALEDPDDHGRLCAYLETLPRFEGRHVLEGDLLATADEARGLLRAERLGGGPGLTRVEAGGGALLHLGDREGGTLVAAVDAASFWRSGRSAATITDWLREATGAWAALCPGCTIRFDPGTRETPGAVHFTVRYHPDEVQGAMALVSSPLTPADRRTLWLTPAFFARQERRAGALEHAIGHLLGFLHEARGPAVCVERRPGEWSRAAPGEPSALMGFACGPGDPRRIHPGVLDCAAVRSAFGGGAGAGACAQLAAPEAAAGRLIVRQ